MLAYFNGQLMDDSLVAVSPYDRGFLFGDGVYDVVRSYGGRLFYLDRHLSRLESGLRATGIEGVDVARIGSIAHEIIGHNHSEGADSLFYIQVTRGAGHRRTHDIDPAMTPTVFATSFPFAPYTQKMESGMKAILQDDIRWSRCDIKSISLLASILGNRDAIAAGGSETLWVRGGLMTEGTHTNFAAVKGGSVFTPPLGNFILPGITRALILEICRKAGIESHETDIPAAGLNDFDEMMAIGTASEILPIVRVDDWTVGTGRPGPVTRLLQEEFRKLHMTGG